MPVEIDSQRQLAVIGGRAFVSSSDYRALAERFRSGDLKDLSSDNLFRNVSFADEADLDHAALRVARAAREFDQTRVENSTASTVAAAPTPEGGDAPAEDRRAEASIRRGLDRRAPFADSIRRFTEQIDASEPAQTYQSILTQAADLVRAERGSLLLFDESTNHLTMTASRGSKRPSARLARLPWARELPDLFCGKVAPWSPAWTTWAGRACQSGATKQSHS